MHRRRLQLRIDLLILSVVPLSGLIPAFPGESNPGTAAGLEPGVTVTFSRPEGTKPSARDVALLPNAALYVPAGQSPTPFLPAGRFVAEWAGFISVELRDNFTFQTELNGEMKLEINGALVLEAAAGTNTLSSKPVRLNKGTNAFTLRYVSPAEGDAFIRLQWSSREFPFEPISTAALSHATTPASKQAEQLRKGRELFVEFRCAKCHLPPPAETAMPELTMDAPALDDLGARRNPDWMSRWIRDPRALRPTAHMPTVLHGTSASAEATAIAAYLSSLPSALASASAGEPTAEQIAGGRKLLESLHCVACHNDPASTGTDPTRISLRQVGDKFRPGQLAEFLKKPDAHYAWIRMPDFKLTNDEAAQLAAYLGSAADKTPVVAPSSDAAVISLGRKLVRTSGCLNCHSLKGEDSELARPPVGLSNDKLDQGCLADASSASSRAPQFGFNAADREALRAFLATDRSALSRHVPGEFALRQTRLLNCRECHGKVDGFPPIDLLGGKLRPEWSRSFIAGDVAAKPRFWLDARMPAFHARAAGLAEGLASLHGYPPKTPIEPPVDDEAAKVGQKLVAAPPDGFACVQCHGIAKVGATQVFESNGINLALTGGRLLKPYYQRWLRNPLRIDPATKMPVYFDEEGRSPLADVFGGDGAKQVDAIWQYIRLGDRMPPPPGTQPAP